MEIQKIFSNTEDENEKLYSVLMTEDEVALFSEFQKEFARRDYEGLSNKGKENLAKRRSEYAKELKAAHSKSMNDISRIDPSKVDNLHTRGSFSGGGVRSGYDAITTKGISYDENFKQLHKNNVNNQLLGASSKAKKIMRDEVMTPEMSNNISEGILAKNRGDKKKFIRDSKLKESDAIAKKNFQDRVVAYKQSNRLKRSQESIAKHAEKAKELKNLKNKRIVSKTVLGAAAGIGLAYGGKKLYDHYKKKNDKEN